MVSDDEGHELQELERERSELLGKIEGWLERPMIFLAFVWLVLLIYELTVGERTWTVTLGIAIWIVFIVDFAVRFAVAPSKLVFLKRNWLTAISLFVPALRALRIFALARFLRVSQVMRGARLVRVVSSINRGMGALGATMRRRGFGYVVLLTVIVIFTGAAGMLALERHVPDPRGLHNFGTALWWTSMIVTTMGSDYWPRTTEGRLLCFLLALYAFAVFGYVTATIASFFVGRDAEDRHEPEITRQAIDQLRGELAALKDELRRNRQE